MKTKTINGTNVEITGLCNNNIVIVKVAGRNNLAQVDAKDLIKPNEDLPQELSELIFFDASNSASDSTSEFTPNEEMVSRKS